MIHQEPLAVRHERAIDRLVNVVAVVGPITTVPQIVEIWFVDHSAAGVSLVTWSLFLVMAAIWLLYGLAHRARPIVVSNSLWLVMQALVVAGAIRYDFDWW